jgi:hypothetical protein
MRLRSTVGFVFAASVVCVACVPEPTSSTEREVPTAYLGDGTDDDVAPAYARDDVAHIAQEALHTGVFINADAFIAAFDEVDSFHDDDCPGGERDDAGLVSWYLGDAACTSSSGAVFSGAVDVRHSERGFILASQGTTLNVQLPDGRSFVFAGYLSKDVGPNDDGSTGGGIYFDGTATSTIDATVVDPLLTGALSGVVNVNSYENPDYKAASVSIALGARGEALGGAAAVVADEVGAATDACAAELTGTVSVRDPGGVWYDIVFNGDPEGDDEFDDALCDGCGELVVNGAGDGDACLDGAADDLLNWSVSPW